MALTSYAQNFEDVMLWRALSTVENGTYIDVGAQHPVIDSVSKAFYDRGWRGVHFEPVKQYAELLRVDRPDEIVLEVALSDENGIIELNVISDTGLSTAVKEHAAGHAVSGFESERVQVPALTLASACKSLFSGDVHWMKIDVEGFEANVLRGWDANVLRPWIVVVEATRPLTTIKDHEAWEPILEVNRYQFAYFDGLNRFYVAHEHAHLIGSFDAPPNVFDDAQLSGVANSTWCRGLNEEIERLRANLKAQKEEASIVYRQLQDSKDAELHALRQAKESERQNLETNLAARTSVGIDLGARLIAVTRTKADIEAQLHAVNRSLADLRAHAANCELAQRAAEKRIHALLASSSWRYTRPLRALKTLIDQRDELRSQSMSRLTAKALIAFAMGLSARSYGLRRCFISVSKALGLYEPLRRVFHEGHARPAQPSNVTGNNRNLSLQNPTRAPRHITSKRTKEIHEQILAKMATVRRDRL